RRRQCLVQHRQRLLKGQRRNVSLQELVLPPSRCKGYSPLQKQRQARPRPAGRHAPKKFSEKDTLCKSFCKKTSKSSATAAISSLSTLATRAIFCCRASWPLKPPPAT